MRGLAAKATALQSNNAICGGLSRLLGRGFLRRGQIHDFPAGEFKADRAETGIFAQLFLQILQAGVCACQFVVGKEAQLNVHRGCVGELPPSAHF